MEEEEPKKEKGVGFSKWVKIATLFDSLALGAPQCVSELAVGVWMSCPPIVNPKIVELDKNEVEVFRIATSQGKFALVSEVLELAKLLGASQSLIEKLESLSHGDALRTSDYRGCGVFTCERVYSDILLHPRENEYGYSPPHFFFADFDVEGWLQRHADLTFFTEFMDDASFVKLNERVAQKGNHIPRGKDVVVVMIYDCPEVTQMDWIDDNFSLQFPYARLWLRHVGRRERAARVAKIVVRSVFNTHLPVLVCDLIAKFCCAQ